MTGPRSGIPVDPPGEPCRETWADEVGCLGDWPHECAATGKHTIHRCRDCDAMVIEDRP